MGPSLCAPDLRVRIYLFASCDFLSLQASALRNLMSARNNLEEALRSAPVEINGHWYTADELRHLGLTPGTIEEMNSTKGKLIKGLLFMQRVRFDGKDGPRVKYFCKPMDGQAPSNTMQGICDIEENERNRPSIGDAMRVSRSSRRASAGALEVDGSVGRGRRRRSKAQTPSPMRQFHSPSVTSSIESTEPAPSEEMLEPTTPPQTQVGPTPGPPSSRPRSGIDTSMSALLTSALTSISLFWAWCYDMLCGVFGPNYVLGKIIRAGFWLLDLVAAVIRAY